MIVEVSHNFTWIFERENHPCIILAKDKCAILVQAWKKWRTRRRHRCRKVVRRLLKWVFPGQWKTYLNKEEPAVQCWGQSHVEVEHDERTHRSQHYSDRHVGADGQTDFTILATCTSLQREEEKVKSIACWPIQKSAWGHEDWRYAWLSQFTIAPALHKLY